MTRVESAVNIGATVALLLLCFIGTVAAITHLDIGLDISDAGFYLLSYDQPNDVYVQTTLFGVIWDLISPFRGIVANRLYAVFFVQFAFASLAIALCSHFGFRGGQSVIIAVLIGVAGSLHYLASWLPDPNYNLLNIIFITFTWTAFFFLLTACRKSERAFRPAIAAWAFVIGALIVAGLLIKITSAALMGLTIVATYFWFDRHNLSVRRVGGLAVSSAGGISVLVCVLTLFGFSPLRVYETMMDGYAVVKLLIPGTLGFAEPIYAYWTEMSYLSVFALFYIGAGILLAVGLYCDKSLTSNARILLSLVAGIGFAAAIVYMNAFRPTPEFINGCFWAAAILVMASAPLAPPGGRSKIVLLVLLAPLSLFIFTYGTGTGWAGQFTISAGLAWAPIGTALVALPRNARSILLTPILVLLTFGLLAAGDRAYLVPYRMGVSMDGITESVPAGPYDDKLKVPSDLVPFYERLAAVQPMVQALDYRPMLIDMTGRAPIVAYLLGAKIPRTPGIFGGYEGSYAAFDLIVAKIDSVELKRAWVLQSDNYEERFPNVLLTKRGLTFPDDYEKITKIPIPYINSTGTLYAPKH
ncbi:MAG: hypothetical protein ACTHKQ_07215 [Mesorhizobium sp.]